MSMDRENAVKSRRGFIKVAAAGTGALALSNIGVKELQAASPPQKWDSEVNVLIAGAGVSGCAAAIAANDAGETSILVLEKMPQAGGSGVFSSGTILAAGTVFQQEKGIQDSPELWYEEAVRTSEGGVDLKLTRTLIDNAREAFDFLYKAGMRWSFIDPLPGYSAARGYREANGGAKNSAGHESNKTFHGQLRRFFSAGRSGGDRVRGRKRSDHEYQSEEGGGHLHRRFLRQSRVH